MNIADLMMPIADAELHDPEIERLERRAQSEAKRRAEKAWHRQMLRIQAARHAHQALDYVRLTATFYPEDGSTKPDPLEMRRLFTAWQRECLKLMHVPAVTKAHLKEKRRLVKPLTCTRWGDICADEKKLEALVAADEARLARK